MRAWLLSRIEREWPVIRQAPWSFGIAVMSLVSFFLILMLLGFGLWYGRELRTKQADIESLEREVRRFQWQIAQGPRTTTEQNRALRENTLRLVGELRRYVESTIEAAKQESRFATAIATASRSISIVLGVLPDKIELDHDRFFRVRVAVLRDDLLLRLPPTARDEMVMGQYGRPTLDAMRAVANDLERLARMLPD